MFNRLTVANLGTISKGFSLSGFKDTLAKAVKTGFVSITQELSSVPEAGCINIPDLIRSGYAKRVSVQPVLKEERFKISGPGTSNLKYLDCNLELEIKRELLPNVQFSMEYTQEGGVYKIPFNMAPTEVLSCKSTSKLFKSEYFQNDYWNSPDALDITENSALYELLKSSGFDYVLDKVDAIIGLSNLHVFHSIYHAMIRPERKRTFLFNNNLYDEINGSISDIIGLERSIKEWVESLGSNNLIRSHYDNPQFRRKIVELYNEICKKVSSKNTLTVGNTSQISSIVKRLVGKAPLLTDVELPEGIQKVALDRDMFSIFSAFDECRDLTISDLFELFRESLKDLLKSSTPEDRMLGIYLCKAFQVTPNTTTPPELWNDLVRWLNSQNMLEYKTFRDPVKFYNLMLPVLRETFKSTPNAPLSRISVSENIKISPEALFNRYSRLNWEYGFFFIKNIDGVQYLCFKIGAAGDHISIYKSSTNNASTAWRNKIILCKFPLENRNNEYVFDPEKDSYLIPTDDMSSLEQFVNFLTVHFRCTFGKDSERFPIRLGCFQRRSITTDSEFFPEEISEDTTFIDDLNSRLAGTLLMREVPNPEHPEEKVPLWYRLSLLMSEEMCSAYRKVYSESVHIELSQEYNHKVHGDGYKIYNGSTQKDEAYNLNSIKNLIAATIINVNIAAMVESLGPMGFDMASGIISQDMLQKLFDSRNSSEEEFMNAVMSIENALKAITYKILSYKHNVNTTDFVIDVFPRINGTTAGSKIDIPGDINEEVFFREFLQKLSPNNDMLDCKLLNTHEEVFAPLLACIRKMCRANL